MRDVLRLFTPPEWPQWHWLARLAFAVVYIGLMVPIIWGARLLGEFVVRLLFG